MEVQKFLSRIPYLFSSALLGTMASYILYINISKDLSFQDFSTVSYWMNLGSIFTVLFDLGVNQYLQVNYRQNIRELAAPLLGFKLLSGLLVCAVLLIFVHDANLFFFLVSFMFVSMQAFFSYYLRLQQRFRLDIIFNLVYYAIFITVFLYVLKHRMLSATTLYAWLHFIMRLSLIVVLMTTLLFYFRQKIAIRTLFQDTRIFKRIIGFSFLSILFVGVQNIDAVILFRRIPDAALFSKLSMVIKMGLLNYAFFDAFITLVSATYKDQEQSGSFSARSFRLCFSFALCMSVMLHVGILLLPFLVGNKWSGISDMSLWAVSNNLALYLLLFFQFRLMAMGKIRVVAIGLCCFMACSALISYSFTSYQLFFVLGTVLRLLLAVAYFQVCRLATRPSLVRALQLENA